MYRKALLNIVAFTLTVILVLPGGSQGAAASTAPDGRCSGNGPAPRLVPREWQGRRYGCKCFLGDNCWPSSSQWARLNKTVSGHLVAHVPVESSCHEIFDGPLGSLNTYDSVKCEAINATYADEQWSTDQNALLLWKYFTNHTCPITANPSDSCTLGYYGVYVIKATEHSHIKAGVDFARRHNLRLVIRNTGHDFIGRSTGWGSLVINTHSFKDVDFIDRWSGPGGYRGSAVKIGAGVQGRELLRLAAGKMLQVVTGECPTVGVAGGFIQGGGHGPLTPLYGLAADNVLEFDVITADGQYRTVNAKNDPDLFFALKGGGPGTFGVVTSATLKTFPELPSAGADLFINFTQITDENVFWDGVRIFHKYSNHVVDNGLYTYFEIGPMFLRVKPFVGVNKTKIELDNILKPMFEDLDASNIPYWTHSKEYGRFFDLYTDLFEDEAAAAHGLTGGWTFTHKDVEENNDAIVDAFKVVISPRPDLVSQGFIVGHFWDAGYRIPTSNSATHPRFRGATDLIISILPVPIGASLAQKADLQDVLTNVQDEALKKAGPNGCAYVNEADPYQLDWQTNFWGSHYPALVAAKRKWDPHGLFYAIATPGTESWEVIEEGERLCKRLD